MGYSPWGCKELDMTEQLTLSNSYNLVPSEVQLKTGALTPAFLKSPPVS